jgi:hypothetical protein
MPIIHNPSYYTSNLIDTATLTTIGGTGITNSGTISIGGGYSSNTFPNSHNPVIVVSQDTATTSTLRVHGNLDLNGVDVGSALADIMSTLLVVKRDLKMEERYPKIKEAYDAYHKILENYKLIDMMKGEQ